MIIYNKIIEGNYGSVIQNIRSKKILKTYSMPIYSINNNGKYALTLNFSRLNMLRPGYGYKNINDTTNTKNTPNNDGIWLIDLERNTYELIINLKDLSEYHSLNSMKNAKHYVNHLCFSPSGTRFLFLHLWQKSFHRYSRLISSNFDGTDLFVLEDKIQVSHYTWKSDSEILATLKNRNSEFSYYLYFDKTRKFEIIGENDLKRDGHPSFSPKGDLILTDTYPDKYGEQHLLLYNKKNELIDLHQFYSPLKFRGEVRCDLHPRWDRRGHYISVDSAMDGKRAIYLLKLKI
jgi:hypothetical protein